MSQEDAAEFSRAVNLAHTNDKATANAIFKGLASKYPANIMALLWVAFTAPTATESKSFITRAAQLEPKNPDVLKAQEWLESMTYESLNIRLTQAITLARGGNKIEAYQDLKALAKETNAKDANVLLWLAFTSPDLAESETAIQMAESQSPANPNIKQAREWLQQEKLRAAGRALTTAPVAEFQPAPVNIDFNSSPYSDANGLKPPSQVLKPATDPQTQAGTSGWGNPIKPDFQPTQTTLGRGKPQINAFVLLSAALGVLIIALIVCAVLFFTSNSAVASNNVFDKAGLPVFSEIETLNLSQSLRDQLSRSYTNTNNATSNVKVTQVDFYKIKTTSSEVDFINFYKSELDKAGWNVQSVPIPTVSQQPFIVGIKGRSYILLGAAKPGSSSSELSSAFAPNQSMAFAMLFEQVQPTTNN